MIIASMTIGSTVGGIGVILFGVVATTLVVIVGVGILG